MNVNSWVQITFDAGHAPVEDPCPAAPDGPHGHRYLLRAYIEGVYDPKRPSPIAELRAVLADMRDELRGTVIERMLPGISTTPAGIAAWALERLPQCAAIEVSQDSDAAVRVSR